MPWGVKRGYLWATILLKQSASGESERGRLVLEQAGQGPGILLTFWLLLGSIHIRASVMPG